VRIEPVPGDWYTLETPPQTVNLPPDGIATAPFAIRVQQEGRFWLQVNITGDRLSDSTGQDITIEHISP